MARIGLTTKTRSTKRNVVVFVVAAGLSVGLLAMMQPFHTELDTQSLLKLMDNRNLAILQPNDLSQQTQVDVYNNNNNDHDDKGWKPIHVFYGDETHLRANNAKSQCGQDDLVLALLKQKQGGFFIDLASNDATHFSNTYHLEKKKDWNGLCMEPNEKYWRGLSYRKCQVVAAVVGKTRMEQIKFKMHANARAASGGIEGPGFDNDPRRPKTNAQAVDMFTVPLLEILEKFDAPRVMDYLSLDIEGAEYFVMKDFPYESYTFRVMTVERPKQELVDLLYTNGYRYLAGNNEYGMETVWVHESALALVDLNALQELKWIRTDTKWIKLNGDPLTTAPTVLSSTS